MRVLVAPDSYKGNLTAVEVATYMEQGILEVLPDAKVVKLPLADGGEGTVNAIVNSVNGKKVTCEVTGPLGEPVQATYGVIDNGRTAIVEMAAASGIMLLSREQLNPMVTTTYGTGQLIKAALDANCEKIIVGLGGSATNDFGIGAAQALGVHFLDGAGKEVGYGGGELAKIRRIDMSDLDPRIMDCEIIVASDVLNPLCGVEGAAAIFGPQKGATPEMIKTLDEGLRHIGNLVREQLGIDILDMKGAGAAGGLGGGLVAFLGAKIQSGIQMVLEAIRFERWVEQADLIITGEGRLDQQTIYGKAPVGVACIAKQYGKPVVCIAGAIQVDEIDPLYDMGIDVIIGITQSPVSLSTAMANAPNLLKHTVKSLMRSVMLLR